MVDPASKKSGVINSFSFIVAGLFSFLILFRCMGFFELGNWGGVGYGPNLSWTTYQGRIGLVGWETEDHTHTVKGCSELAGWRRDTEMVIWIIITIFNFSSIFIFFLHLHLHLPRDWGLGLDLVGFGFGFGVWNHTDLILSYYFLLNWIWFCTCLLVGGLISPY